MKEIEEVFQTLTEVLFAKRLSGVETYEEWLRRDIRQPSESRSPLSGKGVFSPPLLFYKPASRGAIKAEEVESVSALELGREAVMKLTLANAPSSLRSIAFHTPEKILGRNEQVVECCPPYIDSSICYRCTSFAHCKYCAYSFWPRDSEAVFGSDTVFSSKYCLKCYNSLNLSRCFEVSHSSHCSDCLFCHNCDACSDCLFCFNAKALRYAIFNHELGREKYMEVKKRVVADMVARLEKNKKLEMGIFNIGQQKHVGN